MHSVHSVHTKGLPVKTMKAKDVKQWSSEGSWGLLSSTTIADDNLSHMTWAETLIDKVMY